MKKIRIAILGSCVSREIFNYCKEDYEITVYIYRSPIETIFEKPIRVDFQKFIADSNFAKRMVFNEFNKLTFDTIQKNKADYLILDISDCRFSIIEVQLADYTTRIVYTKDTIDNLKNLIANGSLDIVDYKIINISSITNEEWDRYVDSYVNEILSIYEEDRIILNKVKVCTKYLDKNMCIQRFPADDMSISSIERIKLLEKLLLKKMPKSSVLENPPAMLANIDHHLGLNPLHYFDQVYEFKKFQLAKIIKSNIFSI